MSTLLPAVPPSTWVIVFKDQTQTKGTKVFAFSESAAQIGIICFHVPDQLYATQITSRGDTGSYYNPTLFAPSDASR